MAAVSAPPPGMVQRFAEQSVLAKEMLQQEPRLGLTAMIMAGDRLGGRYWLEEVRKGKPIEKAMWLVGSYERVLWAYQNVPIAVLMPVLPALWRDSDPDDTDPRMRALWRMWREWRGRNKTPFSDRGRPPRHPVTVYRGQVDPPTLAFEQGTLPFLGLSWSRSEAVAEKFARGAAWRQGHHRGYVVVGALLPGLAFAHLWRRGEAEVVAEGVILKDFRRLPE